MKCSILLITALSALCGYADPPKTERIPGTEINKPIPGALAGEPAAPGEKAKPPAFLIGVWYQPASSFTAWQVRGINTLFGYESEGNSVSVDDWNAAAVGNGLFMVRQPRANLRDDADEEYLLAWMQPDEPDQKKIDPEDLQTQYKLWKQTAANRPVLLNVSGGDLLFKKTSKAQYAEYFKAADWIGNDFYPVTGWNQPTWIPRMGQAVDQCRQISGGKPQFAFIETSNQQLAWLPKTVRGVTAGELRAEVWHAVIHGVKGIVYFTQQFNPFKFDATPAVVSAEMARQNRLLTLSAPYLAGEMNPKGMTASVNPPMEVGWRKGADGKVLVVVLNLSDKPQVGQPVTMTGDFKQGKATVLKEDDRSVNVTPHGFVDDFEAFGVHVYELGGVSQGAK
jgi:hypothetical protein